MSSIPSVGEDLQVGVGGDKHVRGIVSRVERTVSEWNEYISVHIADDEHALNDDSDYHEVNWWDA
jgi:prophage tail gpP-like protein